MGECRDCRWWRAKYPDLEYEERYYPWLVDWGLCDRVASRPLVPERGFGLMLCAKETELVTAPTFGCNQWAPKELT